MTSPSWMGGGGGVASGGGGATPSWMQGSQADTTTSPDATQAKLDALLTKQNAKGGGGFFDSLKSIGGDILGDAAKVISTPASVLVSAGNQLGNVGSAILGRNQDDPNYRPSLSGFFGDIGKGITAGQVVQQSHPNWSPWVKDVTGGALGLAADPLNALAPGVDSAAREGLVKAGQVVGDEVARKALQEGGVDALRTVVEKRLAEDAASGAVEHGGATTLEDVLARGTQSAEDNLGGKSAEQVVQDRLTALDAAKPGAVLKTPGALPDIGVPGSAKAADLLRVIKGSDVGQAAAKVFQNTAGVQQELGKGAADATSEALHTAAAAKMEAKAAGIGADLQPGAFKALMDGTGGQAVADNLVKDAPEIAQTATDEASAQALSEQGWKQLPGTSTFVHPEVDKALQAAVSAPPSDAVAMYDKAMSKIKQLTVFNPLNAIQHNAKRATYSTIAEMTHGGDLASRSLSGKMYDAVHALIKSDVPVTAENFVKAGWDEAGANQAEAYYKHLIRDNPLYETGEAAGKGGVLGTRKAAAFAEKNTTISRGSVFLNALKGGDDAATAAAKSRAALLDFSNATMTPFERDKLQRLAFFYKFPRQAIPAGVGYALQHPGEANMLSHVGLGVQQGARNQYGEHIGAALDTPLEQGISGLGNIIQNPEAYALGEANPLINAALDSKKRGVGDILPPVGMVQKHVQNAMDANGTGDKLAALMGSPSTSDVPGAPGPGGIPLPGALTGEDYNLSSAVTKNDTGKSNFDSAIAVKAKANGNITRKEALSLLADKAGVANPYGMTEAALLQALGDKGFDTKEITTALQTKVSAQSVLKGIKP